MKHKSWRDMVTLSAMTVLATVGAVCQQASAQAHPELALQLQNPVASLISVPIKLDWDTGLGEADADRSTYVVQPVIPVSIGDEWNMISRSIAPVYIDADSTVTDGVDISGYGDILQSFFFTPKEPTESGLVWGVGPVLSLPTASEDMLGTEQFSVGPTVILLKQQNGWTFFALVNHLWSVSGDDDRADVNVTFLQPGISYTTKSHTNFGVNTESLYDWESEQWTVPVNLSVSQLVTFGNQPVNFSLSYRNYLQAPDNGPDWGVRLQVALLFPK